METNILVVDDDAVDRMAIVKDLDGLANIFEAKTGSEAINLIKKVDFDCIILDYKLPDFDSTHIIKLFNHKPIIVVTGSGDELLAVKLMKLGVKDYLPKDNLEGISEKVSDIIDEQNILKKKLSDLGDMNDQIKERLKSYE